MGSLRAELLQEKIERERLAKETQAIELAKKKGEILLADDVARFHLQLAATLVTTLETFPELLDRELPEKPPAEKDWSEIRARALASADRIVRDCMALAQEFTHDGKEKDASPIEKEE